MAGSQRGAKQAVLSCETARSGLPDGPFRRAVQPVLRFGVGEAVGGRELCREFSSAAEQGRVVGIAWLWGMAGFLI